MFCVKIIVHFDEVVCTSDPNFKIISPKGTNSYELKK